MLVGAALGYSIGVATVDKPFTGLLIGIGVGALVGLAARKDPGSVDRPSLSGTERLQKEPTVTFSVNCSILLTELPLLERPAAAKAAGFDAVEFWWPFAGSVPGDAELSRFERAITDAGVQLTGLNFDAGDMPAGDRGLVSWIGRDSEFRDNIDVVAGIGARLGCTSFNALYGNRQDEHAPEAQDDLAVRNLAAAAGAVARIGGTVLLEPLSGAPRYPLLTADDALRTITRVRRRPARTTSGCLQTSTTSRSTGTTSTLSSKTTPATSATSRSRTPRPRSPRHRGPSAGALDHPQPRARLRGLRRPRVQGPGGNRLRLGPPPAHGPPNRRLNLRLNPPGAAGIPDPPLVLCTTDHFATALPAKDLP